MLNNKGQTLIELIVVMTVLVLIIGALVFATIASLRNAKFSQNQTQATKLAQEGLERVRVGRDRNATVTIPNTAVTSWNGSSSTLCSGSTVIKADSLWCFQISIAGSCDEAGTDCYFNIDSNNALNNKGFSLLSMPSNAEAIPPPPENPVFKRVILLSDDLNWQNQKEVSAVVTWTDFAGVHESRLTTILRRL